MSDRVVPFGSSKSGPETDDEGNTTTVVKRNKRTRSFARSNTEFRSKRHSAIRVSERLSNIEIQAGMKLLKKGNFASRAMQDGAVDFKQFQELLQSSSTLRVTKDEAHQLMNKYDIEKTGRISLEDFCFNLHVPTKRFNGFVQDKSITREELRSFPLTLMMFAAFIAATFFQSQIKYSFEVHEVVHEALVRAAPIHPETVSTIPAMWKWTKETLAPAVDFQSLACGQATGRACIGPSNFVLSNRIILLQKRLPIADLVVCEPAADTGKKQLSAVYAPKGCPAKDEDLKIGLPICSDEAGNATCVPKPEWDVSQRWPKDALNSSSEGFELKPVPDYDCAGGILCSSDDEGYSFTLDAGSPKELLKQLTYLEDRSWIGSRTCSVEILFVVYTPQVGLLDKVRMTFYLHPGGDVEYHLLVDSILEPLQWGARDTFFSVLWWLIIIGLPLQDLTSSVRLGLGRKERSKLISTKFWFSPWRLLMIVHVLLMIVMFVLWRVIMNMVSEFADDSVDGFGEMSQLHQAVDHFFFYRSLAVGAILLFILRFFHSFDAVDQLSIIYLTLQRSIADLINFGIVFAIILAAFISSSMLIFGNQLKAFATFMEAMATNYHGIVGELDFESLLSVQHIKYLAFGWWVGYVLFVVIVVFNMMLAIVLRSYEEAIAENNNARGFLNQIRDEVYLARAKIKGWVTLRSILDVMQRDDVFDGAFVSANELYQSIAEIDAAKLQRNPQYARQYLLSLFQEYVMGHNSDEAKGYAMKAFKRIDELDGDFEHLHTRIDDITSGLKTVVQHVDPVSPSRSTEVPLLAQLRQDEADALN